MEADVPAERFLINQSCPYCNLPVYADEGYYSVNGSHYDCHKQRMGAVARAIECGDAALSRLTGRKAVTPRGEGEPTRRLKALARVALEEFFEAQVDGEVTIYLNPPVWNQYRFDVMRFTGSATIAGQKYMFGSWFPVTTLARHKKLRVTDDRESLSGYFELFPVENSTQPRAA